MGKILSNFLRARVTFALFLSVFLSSAIAGVCPTLSGTGIELAAKDAAKISYGILTYSTGDNAYLGLPSANYTVYVNDAGAGFKIDPATCSGSIEPGGSDDEPQLWPPSNPNGSPSKTADRVPQNHLNTGPTFSGKNFRVVVIGDDLVDDINNDGCADHLAMPEIQSFTVPGGATIEKAFLYYTGSVYLNSGSNVIDDTPDNLNSKADAENNAISFRFNDGVLESLSPLNAGGDSRADFSWWALHSREGTLKDSKVAFYNNRLDVTSMVSGLGSGTHTIDITNLERYDGAGNQKDSTDGSWLYPPGGSNGNGVLANDCVSGASYSLLIILSEGASPAKTIVIHDGISWVWLNDFATDPNKTYSPITSRLSLDVNMSHEAIDGNQPLNLYIGAIDGDPAFKDASKIPQCGSYPYLHNVGQDYTWVRSGQGTESLYFNLYEGAQAPDAGVAFNDTTWMTDVADGRTWGAYSNATGMTKGINYNVVKLGVEFVQDQASETTLHFEADSGVSTIEEQEAYLVNFVLLEGTLASQVGPGENQKPMIVLNSSANMTLTVGDTFIDPGATATDPEDGDLTNHIVTVCDVDTYTEGTYRCDYDVVDFEQLAADTVSLAVAVEAAQPLPPCWTDTNAAHLNAGRLLKQYYSYYENHNGVKGEYIGSTFLDASKVIHIVESSANTFNRASSCP